MNVPTGYVGQQGNEAVVYAEPGATVQLSVGGQNVGTPATTNSYGKATIEFDLPESITDSLLYGDRVKLDATARTEGGRLVRMHGDDALIGQFVHAKITGCTTWSLVGELR